MPDLLLLSPTGVGVIDLPWGIPVVRLAIRRPTAWSFDSATSNIPAFVLPTYREFVAIAPGVYEERVHAEA